MGEFEMAAGKLHFLFGLGRNKKKELSRQRKTEIRTLLDFFNTFANQSKELVLTAEQGEAFCSALGSNIHNSQNFLRVESEVNAAAAEDLGNYLVRRSIGMGVREARGHIDFVQDCYGFLIDSHLRGKDRPIESLFARFLMHPNHPDYKENMAKFTAHEQKLEASA